AGGGLVREVHRALLAGDEGRPGGTLSPPARRATELTGRAPTPPFVDGGRAVETPFANGCRRRYTRLLADIAAPSDVNRSPGLLTVAANAASAWRPRNRVLSHEDAPSYRAVSLIMGACHPFTMRISFDLDDTLICYQPGVPCEPSLPWHWRLLGGNEPLRRG